MITLKINEISSLISISGNYDDDCKVFLFEESYKAIKNKNLKINIQCSQSMSLIKGLQLYLGTLSGSISIYVGTNNSKVCFCENTKGKYHIELWGSSEVYIGSGSTSNGIEIICNNSTFSCGKDCMFSSDILVQSSDQHGIFDIEEKVIYNNQQKNVTLGNHVWLGRRCTILPNSEIGTGSVIGSASVVNGKIPTQVIAAGSPAKVIKQNRTWSRSFYKINEDELKHMRNLNESNRTCQYVFENLIIKENENMENNLSNSDGKVTVGRNGRLFIANDSNQVILQHRGEKLLLNEQIMSWNHLLEVRKTYCASKQIEYYIMVVPDAHAVYKEELQSLDNVTSERPVTQILLNLHDQSYFTYPLNDLNKSKRLGEVYHPSDSHYSGFGAYVCYKSLLKKMNKDITVLSDVDVNCFEKVSSGDLGDKFTPPKKALYTECFVKNPTARKVWNNEVTNRGHMSLWLNQDNKKPKCLLFTDSYGWKIQRFFAESFSELFIVHSPLLETEAIEKFQPDIVITLMAERFLIYTPKDKFDQSAMSFAKEKGSKVISYDEIMLIKEKYKSDLND